MEFVETYILFLQLQCCVVLFPYIDKGPETIHESVMCAYAVSILLNTRELNKKYILGYQ
jgi:hypothetical protein